MPSLISTLLSQSCLAVQRLAHPTPAYRWCRENACNCYQTADGARKHVPFAQLAPNWHLITTETLGAGEGSGMQPGPGASVPAPTCRLPAWPGNRSGTDALSGPIPATAGLPASCLVQNSPGFHQTLIGRVWHLLPPGLPAELWATGSPYSGQNKAGLWPPTLVPAGLPTSGLLALTSSIRAGFLHLWHLQNALGVEGRLKHTRLHSTLSPLPIPPLPGRMGPSCDPEGLSLEISISSEACSPCLFSTLLRGVHSAWPETSRFLCFDLT